MPLAHDGRLVAGPLEQFGEGLLRGVERRAEGVVGVAVGVGVLAREHAGAARTAQRVGHEAVGEAHPFAGDAVEVGRRGVAVVVAAHHLRRMVVGHDVEDVHRAPGRLGTVAAAGGGRRHRGNAADKQGRVRFHGCAVVFRAGPDLGPHKGKDTTFPVTTYPAAAPRNRFNRRKVLPKRRDSLFLSRGGAAGHHTGPFATQHDRT